MSVQEEGQCRKPIVQKIFDEFFTALEASSEFDASILSQLQTLTMDGGMKKHQRVSEVIAGKVGNKDATHRA